MTVTSPGRPPALSDTQIELLKWYMDNAQKDEHFQIDGHEKRIQFLSGLNVAVLTGVGAGLFYAEDWSHYAVVLLGPLFMVITNHFAVEACRRYYNRVLEAIIIKAHIEQVLGLTAPLAVQVSDGEQYWSGEPLVPFRHLDARLKHRSSSKQFFEAHQDRGSQAFARYLLRSYQVIAIVLAVFILIRLWQSLCAP